MDVVSTIKSFNAGRDPELLAMKIKKMTTSPFFFLRGTCHIFYSQLPKTGPLKDAPLTWVCGDLHLENFGSYKGDNRLAYFDINDFDEAVLAPCTWDIVRLLVSVMLGFADLGTTRGEALSHCRTFLASYSAALAMGKARWVDRDASDGLIKTLLDSLKDRPRTRFLDSRTDVKGKRRVIRTDGRKALPVDAKPRAMVEAFVEQYASRQADPGFFRILDVARRIAGTGSLGVSRYIVLVEGKGSPDCNYLLDIKQALPSALAPHLSVPQPAWQSESHRVVAVQRRMQAVSMAFLEGVIMDDRPFILRGLLPSEDRVTLVCDDKKHHGLSELLHSMGQILAWDELRSSGREGSAIADELIAFGKRTDWQEPLLDIAVAATQQVEHDWAEYCKAVNDGAFA
ncbi:MAG: DUF2252 domain-containing protein [Burkholderiales bacterium]|nr:DUF2252 domain-containing protein [Burkholderiales bacterium]